MLSAGSSWIHDALVSSGNVARRCAELAEVEPGKEEDACLSGSRTQPMPSPEASPSREEVAKAQEKMLEELAEIQKRLPQLSKSEGAAKQQAELKAIVNSTRSDTVVDSDPN